jgi:hypothetical protein
MKPSWDKLMKEFKDHPTILVADVDCDGAGKSVCDKHNIEGFPTLRHGSPDSLEDYEGEREFDALKEFAGNLKPTCSPSNVDACTPEDKTEMNKLMEMSKDDLGKVVSEASEKVKAANKAFDDEVDKLQKMYDELEKKKSEAVKIIQTPSLKMAQKVFVHKGGELPKEEEPQGQGDEEDMGEEGDMGDMGDEGDEGAEGEAEKEGDAKTEL